MCRLFTYEFNGNNRANYNTEGMSKERQFKNISTDKKTKQNYKSDRLK